MGVLIPANGGLTIEIPNHHLSTSIYGNFEQHNFTYKKYLALTSPAASAHRTRAYALLQMGYGKRAAESSSTYLSLIGWENSSAVYAALAAYFGYRRDNLSAEADGLLNEMDRKMKAPEWPYPVIKYLKRSITPQQLLSSAKDNGEQTEAHCYLGLDLIYSGKTDEGIEHLKWVKEKGVTSFFEYGMALGELRNQELKKREKAQ